MALTISMVRLVLVIMIFLRDVRFSPIVFIVVHIEGLKPNTKYRYRVFTQEVAEWRYDDWVTFGKTACTDVWRGKPHEFTTFPAQSREITFLVLNDIS